MFRELTDVEMKSTKGGEIITIAVVMAVLATAIVAVIVYRLFMSREGTATIPGGFKFTWDD